MPFRLCFHNSVQYRLIDPLFTGGFQDSDGLFRAFVKQYVAQYQTHVVRVGSLNLFHIGIHGATTFAGWVEELDNGYRRVLRANNGRVIPHQWRFFNNGGFISALGAIVNNKSTSKDNQTKKKETDDQGSGLHGRFSYFK